VPPRKPYSFIALLDDILSFAAFTLVPDGRLSFWMPSANDEDETLEIPMHKKLELVSVCVQPFNKCKSLLLAQTLLSFIN
jgi:tRNA (guanine10-N2)-methyltransferase